MVRAASSGRSLPTVTLTGAAEAIYVRNVVGILRRARLNSHYPPVRPLASHVECMGPQIHGHLYGGLEVDLRSGLPTYKEWVRVKTDAEIAPDALAQIQPRAELVERARRKPETIHGKQLIKHDYYTALLDHEFAELSVMDVALRRIDPEQNTGYFHVLLDKLDVSGTFVRYTIDMAQQSSAWNKPMVTLDEETAGHTDDFKSLIYKFTSLDAEFAFAKLVSMGGLSVERVVKGTVGPFFFSGMQAPKPLETLLAARDGFVATFSIDMAACDLAQDRDNDPMETLLAAELSDAARAEYEEARRRYGYKVFKDRKFVVTENGVAALQAYCTASGTRNIIYPLAPAAARGMSLASRYLEVNARRIADDTEADLFAGTTLAAFFRLLGGALLICSRTGTLRPLVEALTARAVTVAGYPYAGLTQQAATEAPSGLLPLWPEQIVGNDDFLAAGKRLARDVAGYDFRRGRNPKKVNPILFGLGKPGCGKTVTAHAVGNYFLKFCRERDIRARFLVVRRSDWASSYQNASAANLIRLFREEVYGFDGVCGTYWPDIDTALASRSNAGLRAEEKQNLGAVFGIFDGTLLPKDGKWFMICDANTMHMDEAAISRIAQNPFTVEGPTSVDHYVRLMRDLLLRDVASFLPGDADAWQRIGEAAVAERLSGRTVDNICGNVRTHIQDFEYPDEFFRGSPDERDAMVQQLSKPVDEAFFLGAIADWAAFRKEAQEREERERFDDEVNAVVRQLNASRAAVERAAELGIGT